MNKLLRVMTAVALVFSSVNLAASPASAIGPQNVQHLYDANGDSSIYTDYGDIRELRVQAWSSRKYVYFYLRMNDFIEENAFGNQTMEAILSLDTTNDGVEDYWVPTGGYFLSRSLTPVPIYKTSTGLPLLGCFAYLYGNPQNYGQWLGWLVDPACVQMGESFGAKASVSKDQSYGTGALPPTSDFVPNSGFGKVNNPTLQNFKRSANPTIFGTVKVGSTLSVATGIWDLGVAFKYQWLSDGKAIKGATSASYKVSAADAGKSLSVNLIGTKRGYRTVAKVSAPSKVQDAAFTLTSRPSVAGTVAVDNTVTADAGRWDAGVKFAYQWSRDSQLISGASTATYAVVAADVGTKLSVTVTATKLGFKTQSSVSLQYKVAAGTFTSKDPLKITGSNKAGSTLKVDPGSWAPGATISYQWLRGGKEIKNANESRFLLKAVDKGTKISVKVTVSKLGYNSLELRSESVSISK
jgi:hypothetical protein